MALKFVAVERPKVAVVVGDRLEKARKTFIEGLEKQKEYVAAELRNEPMTGKKLRRHYFVKHGTYYLDAVYGVAKIKLDGVHSTVEVGKLEDVPAVLDEIRGMAEAGALDEALLAVAGNIAARRHGATVQDVEVPPAVVASPVAQEPAVEPSSLKKKAIKLA